MTGKPSLKKQYSIAEARDRLPRLVHEAERGIQVELTRRGRPVAVILSALEHSRMTGSSPGFNEALERYRRTVDLKKMNFEASFFEGLRDRTPGREVGL